MRKLMGSCFIDQNFEIVWRESIAQATDMGHYWSSRPSVETIADDTRTLSLNVMSRAGFGKSYPFKGHHEAQVALAGASLSYKDALQTILENSIVIMIFGTKFLAKPWLPPFFKRLHYACTSFQGYMTELFETEKQNSSQGKTSDRNMMTSLVRASNEESYGSLTEKEIYGNSKLSSRSIPLSWTSMILDNRCELTLDPLVFVFNFAGHDTTAHTFVWVMYFLAGNPEVQDWVHEEIQHVLGDRPKENWDYKSDFPRLKRCMAVLFETMRLYTPVGMAKWTADHAATLQVGEKTLVIPPRTMVVPSNMSTQTDPKYWGSNSLTWRPSRWIRNSPSNSESINSEELISPLRGTFLSWSDGARDCPGKKFSQVEAVATIASLFKDWQVDPVSNSGETVDDARSRVLQFIKEDTGMVLLVQLLHPERFPLIWTKR